MTALPAIARSTAERYGLFPQDAPVLVMVSGGGDSIALLHLLATGVFGEHPLRALHVNHLLRGLESDADQAFVEESCAARGIECRSVRYDVSAYAGEHGLNLEDAGRRVRYRFADEELDGWCADLDVPDAGGRIAVAHTLDDRIETFFMRAVSGSGSGGLSSIAPARGRIVRPLIECDRRSVREHLSEAGLEWREDASNTDTARARAYVREHVVPAVEGLNPAFRASLARTMDLLGDDDALLTRMADGFARDFAEVMTGEVRFNREWMCSLDRTMARRTVRRALHEAFPESSRLEASHVDAVVDGMRDGAFARDLPGGISARSEYATLVVSYTAAPPAILQPSLLTLPGRACLGVAGEVTAEDADASDTTGSGDSVVVDAGSVRGPLVIDSVRDGDRMRPFGMEGSRKLSDLLIDAKIPKRERQLHPVVRDGDTIVWVAGVRMSEEYRVTPNTRRAVRLTWTKSGAQGGAEVMGADG